MEEDNYSQTIIASLSRLHDYVDSLLVKMEDDGNLSDNDDDLNSPPRPKRQVVTSTVKQIIHFVRRKDEKYQALQERSRMLESKLRSVSHVVRALDKMSRIPEVPVFIKQENLSDGDITCLVEEDNQLSIIVETTEPSVNLIEDKSDPNPGDNDNLNRDQENSIEDNSDSHHRENENYDDLNRNKDQENSNEDMSDLHHMDNDDPNRNQKYHENFNEEQEQKRFGKNIRVTNAYLPLQELDQNKQTINPIQENLPPLLNIHGFETSTPKPIGDPTDAVNTSRRFFSKPRIIDKMLKTSTKVNGGVPSENDIKEEETKLNGVQMNNIEMKEIEVSIELCDFYENKTTLVHDDTEKIYSDISSDDEGLPQIARDENKHSTRRSKSHESESGTSSASNQMGTKFKLKEAILNVDKICSTEQFKHSQSKIEHELLKNTTNKHKTRQKIYSKNNQEQIYEDKSNKYDKERHLAKRKIHIKNKQDQIYEDISDEDNFTDAMSKISNSPEHELIDLTEIEDEATRGKRTIWFEEPEPNGDTFIAKDLVSEEKSTDSADQVNDRETSRYKEDIQDEEGHENEDLDDQDSEYDGDDKIDVQDEYIDRESIDGNNDDNNVSINGEDDDANDNAEQTRDLESVVRRRRALWKPKRETEGVYMEAISVIDFDLTVSPDLTNEKQITQSIEHLKEHVDIHTNSSDAERDKLKSHTAKMLDARAPGNHAVDIDLLTIKNYDSSDDSTLLDFPLDENNQNDINKPRCIDDNILKMDKISTNCNIGNEYVSSSEHHRAYEHPDEISTLLSMKNKTLVDNEGDNVKTNAVLNQKSSQINGVGTAITSKETNCDRINRYENEQIEERNKNEQTRDEDCEISDEEKKSLTGEQYEKANEVAQGNARIEDPGYYQDIGSYTSDEISEKTDMDNIQDFQPKMKVKIRKVQKLPVETTSDTDESKESGSSKPRHNLRGRRRKMTASESEEDEIVAKKCPKRQTSKTKLVTNNSEPSKVETNHCDGKPRKVRPKRICAQPRKVTEVQDEDRDQVKPKTQPRSKSQKGKNSKRSEA